MRFQFLYKNIKVLKVLIDGSMTASCQCYNVVMTISTLKISLIKGGYDNMLMNNKHRSPYLFP